MPHPVVAPAQLARRCLVRIAQGLHGASLPHLLRPRPLCLWGLGILQPALAGAGALASAPGAAFSAAASCKGRGEGEGSGGLEDQRHSAEPRSRVIATCKTWRT